MADSVICSKCGAAQTIPPGARKNFVAEKMRLACQACRLKKTLPNLYLGKDVDIPNKPSREELLLSIFDFLEKTKA